jgi:hypothetical protein
LAPPLEDFAAAFELRLLKRDLVLLARIETDQLKLELSTPDTVAEIGAPISDGLKRVSVWSLWFPP